MFQGASRRVESTHISRGHCVLVNVVSSATTGPLPTVINSLRFIKITFVFIVLAVNAIMLPFGVVLWAIHFRNGGASLSTSRFCYESGSTVTFDSHTQANHHCVPRSKHNGRIDCLPGNRQLKRDYNIDIPSFVLEETTKMRLGIVNC